MAVAGLEAPLERLRREALEALPRLEWQPVADSPTVKSYTDWRPFSRLLAEAGEATWERPSGDWDLVAGPCGDAPQPPGELVARLARPSSSKLLAAHYSRLTPEAAAYAENTGGQLRIAFCRPRGGWGSRHLVLRLSGGETLVYIPPGPGSVVVEVYVEPGARARLALVTGALRDPAMGLVAVKLEAEGSELRYGSLAASSQGQLRVEDVNLLAGAGASLKAYSLAVGREAGRLDYILDTVQDAPATAAEAALEGLAFEESLVAARGTARVTRRARRSRSSFDASVLMLGEKSRGYTAPMMEIDTGDVEEASHHASQERASRDALFYLASRGLSAEEAVALITAGKLDRLASTLESLSGLLQMLAAEAAGIKL